MLDVDPLALEHVRGGWERHRGHRELLLSLDAERLPAGGDHGERRDRREQAADEGSGGDHLLDVVEDQQQLAFRQVRRERLEHRRPGLLGHPEGLRDRLGHELRVDDRGEGSERSPVRVLGLEDVRRLQREPRLPRSPRTGERDDAARPRERHEVAKRPLPADEGREGFREAGCGRVQGSRRGELVRKVRDEQLEQAFGTWEVLQVMLPEVAEPDVLAERALRECARRVRHEHLAAVGGAHDPRGPVHVDPHVVAARDRHLAGVHTHPHLQGDVVGPGVVADRALGRDRGLDPRPRGAEHHEERVALGARDVAVPTGLSDDPMMVVEQSVVALAELVQQPRRSLDVGEQQGEGPGRRVGRRCAHAGHYPGSRARDVGRPPDGSPP